MGDLSILGKEIEQEYQLCRKDSERDINSLFTKVGEYIKPTIEMIIRKGNYLDRESVEELKQDVLLVLAAGGLEKYQPGNAQFATYCTEIAKNKAIDWGRKWEKHAEEYYEGDKALNQFVERKLSSTILHLTPEQEYLRKEYVQERHALMKKCLDILVNQDDKPYRTLGCCYTLVLFNLINEDSKELSSPKWAFEKMKEWVKAQGGDESYLEDLSRFPEAPVSFGVKAPKSGYLFSVNTEMVGHAALLLGAGRKTKEDVIDPSAGILLKKKRGEYVEKGEELCILYTSSKEKIPEAENTFLSALTFSEEKPKATDKIFDILL